MALPTKIKGITVEKPGAPAKLATDLAVPEPSDTQILVKSIYTAVNPGDAFMANYGLLVVSWPLIPGCDASGIVVKAGSSAINTVTGEVFKEGDEVFGCTRLGSNGYSPWQEYFLMDAQVTIPKPSNLSLADASTVGVGVLTAFLGIFDGLKIPLFDAEKLPEAGTDWVLVFGGASAVGKAAVQILKAAGYKVATTCSAKSFDLLKGLGADATIDYKKSEDDIISELKSVTDGKLNFVFDAVSVNNNLTTAIYKALASTTSGARFYTTTNDWDPAPADASFTTNPIKLGPVGRPEGAKLNETLNRYIPVIYKLVETGKVKVGEWSVEGEGIEGLLNAWEVQKSGKMGSTKVIVKVSDL